jgi:DNA-binding Xre family transcriptional regulator
MLRFALRRILFEREIRQIDLCKETGLSTMYLTRVVNNKTTTIELDKLEKICDALKIGYDELFEKVPEKD